MVLHLVKLCVGAEDIADLADWQEGRLAEKRRRKQKPELAHITRMVPRRGDALLDGGSLYWVIKGSIRVRQRLLDVRAFIDEDGIRRCALVLDPELVLTELQPRRPFQGWRYLKPEDAPRDLPEGVDHGGDMPAEMRAELMELGLL